jgi:hypothetical protein
MKTDIFDKAANCLQQNLSPEDFMDLGEAMDGDPHDQLLDAINARLSVTNPELFEKPLVDTLETT